MTIDKDLVESYESWIANTYTGIAYVKGGGLLWWRDPEYEITEFKFNLKSSWRFRYSRDVNEQERFIEDFEYMGSLFKGKFIYESYTGWYFEFEEDLSTMLIIFADRLYDMCSQ